MIGRKKIWRIKDMRVLCQHCGFMLLVALLCHTPFSLAQEDEKHDTIQCFIVGFNVGTTLPSDKGSIVNLDGGGTSRNATMHSLYSSPWLNFGLNGFYKWKEGWLASLEGDVWFGNDNLRNRRQRMNTIYTSEGLIIGTNGTDAVVTAYNRGFSAKAGFGKVIIPYPTRNPNSGILAKLSAGYLRQQTIFTLNETQAPQIDDDYALLYDHQRHGLILTQSLGIWFMSNYANLINVYLAFEVSEVWSHSTRDYIIDNHLGLQGKDNNKYFDLLYNIKLCWMFPLKGKSTHEYYYF